MILEGNNKILTWQPKGRKGVYLSKKDYNLLRDFILAVLKTQEVTIRELIDIGEIQLVQKIERDISWHVLIVKLDLEARGLIGTIVKWAPHKENFLKLRTRELNKQNARLGH